MIKEMLTLAIAWMAGGALGAFFFGGLWWTIRKGMASKQPALWFLGSLLLRMSLTLTGFYYVADWRWQRLLLCLLGFVMVRQAATWLTRPSAADQTRPTQEVLHAPYS